MPVQFGDELPRKRKGQPAKSLEATLWEAADELRGNLDSAGSCLREGTRSPCS